MAKYQFAAGIVEQQVNALMLEHPDLMNDEDLKADMLLGSTDFYEIIEKIHLNIMHNSALMHGLIDILDDLNRRREVLRNRVEFQRALIKRLMEVADQKSIDIPTAKISLGKSPAKVIITDETAIPDEFVRTKREPNKTAIKEALVGGQDVPGATLSNGGTSLTIR
jgi:hypothetical protein